MKTKYILKSFTKLAVCALIVVILGFGATALLDYPQHKTNVLSARADSMDVTLNNSFTTVTDWQAGDTVSDIISVTNTGLSNVDVCVRLRLSEYMDISNISHQYVTDINNNPIRFRTYAGGSNIGKFIAFENRSDAENEAVSLGLEASRVKGPYKNALDPGDPAGGKYYIATRFGDDNGQYGKYLVKNIATDVKDIIAGEHVWDKTEDTEHYYFVPFVWGASPAVRSYVSLNFGSSVIRLSTWNGDPVAKWIYDDTGTTTDPYVYWGMLLSPETTTTDLLESVTLLTKPEGSLYYALHVDMEATALAEINDLVGTPQKILDAWMPPPPPPTPSWG